MPTLAEHLQSLELELLTAATRKCAERVSTLLADDFREFGSSGRIFTRQEILLELQEEVPAQRTATDFQVTFLAEDVALVTYKSVRHEPNSPTLSALRSSVWQRQRGCWRMIFHQGTRIP